MAAKWRMRNYNEIIENHHDAERRRRLKMKAGYLERKYHESVMASMAKAGLK